MAALTQHFCSLVELEAPEEGCWSLSSQSLDLIVQLASRHQQSIRKDVAVELWVA